MYADHNENDPPVSIAVMYASQQQVDEYKAQIINDAFYNNILRSSIHGGMMISVLVACYLVYNQLGVRIFDKNNFTPEQQDIKKMLEQQVKIVAALNKISKEFGEILEKMTIDKAGNVVASSGWGSFFTNIMTNIVVSLGIGHILNQLQKYVLYEETIDWFRKERTNLDAVYEEFNGMHPSIENVKRGTFPVTREQADKYLNDVIRLHNALTTEVERLVAYITYKIEKHKISITDTQHDALLGGYLFKRINTIAEQIDEFHQRYQHEQEHQECLLCIAQM